MNNGEMQIVRATKVPMKRKQSNGHARRATIPSEYTHIAIPARVWHLRAHIGLIAPVSGRCRPGQYFPYCRERGSNAFAGGSRRAFLWRVLISSTSADRSPECRRKGGDEGNVLE